MNNTLAIEVGADGIALLTIDVPGRPMNVFTPELIDSLGKAVEQVAADDAIIGAIITSAKQSSFLAGADLKDLGEAFERGITAQQASEFSQSLSKLLRRLETCGKPFVAAINGLALGGGLELCLACHRRILSSDVKAVIGLPEVKVGLLPGAGGTQRLPRLIGIPAALPLLLKGKTLQPSEAYAQGLVHEVFSPEQLIGRARHWLLNSPTAVQPWDRKGYKIPGGAGPLASHAPVSFTVGVAQMTGTTQHNDPAPLAILSSVYEGTIVDIDTGLRIESKYFGKLLSGSVARNMIRTLFINKTAIDKLVNRPSDAPTRTVTRLGVIGAGMMGAGIANVAAQAGVNVVLIDATVEQAEKGKADIAALLARDIKRGRLTQESVNARLARINATNDYAQLKGCELVVEAVFEDRTVKANVTRQVEAQLDDNAVFASNTSTLPITGLAQASIRPERFIGMHFFSPVERMPLVEVIIGEKTSDQTVAWAMDFIAQLRKTPILVRDSPGFFTSRVIMNFLHEGMKMVEEGVLPAMVENAARQAGFPAGPLAVADEVSLSLMQAILKAQDADNLPERYRLRTGRKVIDRMVDQLKRPGRRAGAGFYEYPEQEPKHLWPGLSDAYPTLAKQPSIESLKERFLIIMALETARCQEEGVIINAMDADIGSILGIGYPAWTGGVLSYIETMGAKAFVARCHALAALHGARFEPTQMLKQQAA